MTETQDVWRLFRIIEVPPSRGANNRLTFNAIDSPAGPWLKLACSTAGTPYFLVKTATVPLFPRIRLENLIVEPWVECEVGTDSEGYHTEHLAIIGCSSVDRALQSRFIRLVYHLLRDLASPPTGEALGEAVETSIKLFRVLGEPARKSVQGLWAELLLIEVSSDPRRMVEAWHNDPLELFDFSFGAERLEVKSSSGGRRHHFRLEQLDSSSEIRVMIASMVVRGSGNGVSVDALCDKILDRVRTDRALVEKVARVVSETLGDRWRDAELATFDRETAIESIQFFSAEQVPKPGERMPSEVSEVRFVADLSAVPAFKGATVWLCQPTSDVSPRG